MTFEESEIYKQAKQKFIEATYAEILRPFVIRDGKYADTVFLFYPKDKVQEIYKILVDEYELAQEDKDTQLNLNLGCSVPELTTYNFMGIEYKAIMLWYDGYPEAIPNNFIRN